MTDAVMQRVLVAPDKFKGSLSAAQVARHVAAGLRAAAPQVCVEELPVADGGEGTVEAALAAGYEQVDLTATGPLGMPVRARYAKRGCAAVVEMAAVTGLQMVRPNAMTARLATSRGLGEVVAHALESGARTVVIGVGGSASTDGGAGMLAALGAKISGGDRALPDGGGALRDIREIDFSGLESRLVGAELILASDVGNPLLGPNGAAAIYGPQKGADPLAVAELEMGLTAWVGALGRSGVEGASEKVVAAGAGAAGGVGYACLLLGAKRRSGVEEVMKLTGFDDRVAGVDLVITGEGSLDLQSLHGKVPAGVAEAARAASAPTVAVCGKSALTSRQAAGIGLRAVYALTDVESDIERCIAEAGPLLQSLAGRVAVDQLAREGHR